jgi:hypothetical protein
MIQLFSSFNLVLSYSIGNGYVEGENRAERQEKSAYG